MSLFLFDVYYAKPEYQSLMSQPQFVVRAANEISTEPAQALAQQLHAPYLPFSESEPFNKPSLKSKAKKRSAEADQAPLWSLILEQPLLLLSGPNGLNVSIDFIQGGAASRARENDFKRQPLARAIGVEKLKQRLGREVSVVDATAGFGQDAWMMAMLGCQVTLLEQSPILHCMLQHALHQAQQHSQAQAVANTLALHQTEASQWLLQHSTDVVYLDPMYPMRKKQAKVKKGMQLLHALLGSDNNDEPLFKAAIRCATSRVVVKRPQGADQLAGASDWTGQYTTITSPNTRFDIYHIGTGQ